jgi:hypothetical protein
MKLVRTLHERRSHGARESLVVFELDDGSRVYGVTRNGETAMTGTKAAAKAYYGNERKTW